MDIIGIAVARRAELQREYMALDDFLRQADLLLGRAQPPRPSAGRKPGSEGADSGKPKLMWTNSGFRVVQDTFRQSGRDDSRPEDSLVGQLLPRDAEPADTFIFEEQSRA